MYPKIDRATLDGLLAAKEKMIKEVDLTAINVQKPPVDFSGAVIDSCTLSKLNLRGLGFRKATVKHCWVDGTDFSGADFAGATLIGSFYCKLERASFRGATLKKVEFGSDSVAGADFTDADLEKASFCGTPITGASFRGARLAGTDLEDATLAGVDFTGALLAGAKLKGADRTGAIGLDGATKAAAGQGVSSTVYEAAGAEGGPIVVVPAALAAGWNASKKRPDADRTTDGGDDVVTVAEGVTTGSIAFGAARALVLDGELDTGFVATDDGGVLIRGGDFDDLAAATKAATKALKKKKGWTPHAHDLVLAAEDAFVFSANARGKAKASEIESDFGVVHARLARGTYAVAVLGQDDDDGPIVFIHLRRR